MQRIKSLYIDRFELVYNAPLNDYGDKVHLREGVHLGQFYLDEKRVFETKNHKITIEPKN